MSLHDFCLRTDTEQQMIDALPFARTSDELGERWLETGNGFDLVIIGPVVVDPGEYDEDGNEITPAVIDNGFHVNIRCTAEVGVGIPSNLMIFPDNPRFTWL